MDVQTAKKAGAVIGAIALTSVGVAGVVPALAETNDAPLAATQVTETKSVDAGVSADAAQGSFSFDQNVMSSRQGIVEVFTKSSMALCNALPTYGVTMLAQTIAVSADADPVLKATVAEMVEEAGTGAMVMACACASNLPGGGAIVNTEVSGATLKAIMEMAGVTS